MHTKIVWPKLKLFNVHTRTGKSAEEHGISSNLCDKSSVNEEYREAFRTKSYQEMWGKVQTNIHRLSSSTSSSSSSDPLAGNFYADHHHLSESLLEPRQEALSEMLGRLNPDPLLMDYFDATSQACNICELLLRSVHRTRASYRKIKKVIKLSQRVSQDCADEQFYYRAILGELSRFALLKNPLSVMSPVHYKDIHDSNTVLLQRLASKHKKIRRRAKFNRWCKKAGGIGLVVLHSVVMVLLLVFAFHSVVGVAAAPAIVACGVGMVRKRVVAGKMTGTAAMERMCAQLDVAAKGVYILVNDFDTMIRLVRRLQDEVEHRRTVAGMCVRNVGKSEVLMEVVREFRAHDALFVEQLEELEDHIHLCLLTINRSRRLVTDEFVRAEQWRWCN